MTETLLEFQELKSNLENKIAILNEMLETKESTIQALTALTDANNDDLEANIEELKTLFSQEERATNREFNGERTVRFIRREVQDQFLP